MHQLNVKDKTEMYNHLSKVVLCLNFPAANTGEKKSFWQFLFSLLIFVPSFFFQKQVKNVYYIKHFQKKKKKIWKNVFLSRTHSR